MKPKPLASLNHFTIPCSILFLDFPCVDVALRDRKVSGRNRSYYRRDGCKRAVRTNAPLLYTENSWNSNRRAHRGNRQGSPIRRISWLSLAILRGISTTTWFV